MTDRVAPVASSADVARRMRATRQRDTPAELALRRLLHRRGLRYQVDSRPTPKVKNRADIVFPREMVAVFVDGCFWHGCPEHGTWPKANADWWRRKIEANRQRDRKVVTTLEADGWVAMRMWEHEDLELSADRVEELIRSRRRAASSGSRE
jgi:DNA mismatch endonuclease (patch repair protein)